MAWSATLSTPDGNVPYGDSFTLTRKLSETVDWTLSTREDLRELEPDGSAYANVFDDNAYAPDGITYEKILTVSGTTDSGAAWTLPSGVPDSYSYQINAGDIDGSFTWRGKGIASKLYRSHLSLDSIVSTGSQLVYVQDVLATIFEAYGIDYDVSGVSPNYVVPRMQMQDGSPIEWVRQLLEVTQAEWYEDDTTIVCFQPDWSGDGSNYTYSTDEVELRGMSFSSSAVVDFSNYIVCQRADDTGGVIGRSDKTATDFGRQGYVEFDTPVPVNTVSWSKKVELNGVLSDFYIYGENGPPANPIDAREIRGTVPPLQGGTMAHGVEFTFGAFTGGTPGVTNGSFSVEFRGDNSGGVYPDSVTSLVVQNEASISSGRGKMQSTLGPNPLIADQLTLQTWGERVLYKRSRKQRRISATLHPANYALRPGHVVTIEDALKGTSYRLVVTSVSHNLVADPSQRATSFEGLQYV